MFNLFKNRNFWIVFLGDMSLLALSLYLSYYLRFDGDIAFIYLQRFVRTVVWIVPLKMAFLFWFDLYRGLWRYTSLPDFLSLARALVLGSLAVLVVILFVYGFRGFSRGIVLIDLLLSVVFLSGFRIAIRMYYSQQEDSGKSKHRKKKEPVRILVIGAGRMGDKLLREIRENRSMGVSAVGIIDDDPRKVGHKLHGVSVLGTLNDLGRVAKKVKANEIVIAITAVSAIGMRRIVNFCEATGLPFKTVPGLWEFVEGRVSVQAIREVRYEDLLGREPVRLDVDQIGGYLKGRRVLVTGGAGSIGRELCRQIAGYGPEKLVIVERAESGLYEEDLEIRARYPGLDVQAVLGPVQSASLMERVFREHGPQAVFHAAAYKHVPMMELHAWEAVYNNILGTQNVMEMAHRFEVERMVFVSTDKAVRPTNVMGASKRVGELFMQALAPDSKTRFMAVRFGNVVGSVGSVVPLFRRQIERGGPVTVTHPEVTRYFMTIPEACSLILQAGAIGRGGEIFVLKMGRPIRIDDMARDIILLHGFEPGVDIEIQYTGLRPGEKLYEELITEGEGIEATEHEEIMVLNAKARFAVAELDRHIQVLYSLAQAGDADGIRRELARLVPEYEPAGH